VGTSYKVRVYSIEKRKNKAGEITSYRVLWEVDSERFRCPFQGIAQADSFRSELVTAARKGEAFSLDDGLPVNAHRKIEGVTWVKFACDYMSMKWPDSSPKHRRTLAQSLVTITGAMLDDEKPLPDGKVLRKALATAFNPKSREKGLTPDLAAAFELASRASRRVGDLEDPEVLRRVLRALDVNLNGKRAAYNTARLRRVTLANAIAFATDEKKLLRGDPLREVKTKKRKSILRQVDPAAVVNPKQGRDLLAAVRKCGKQGPPLVGFFACMYYAGLRPEEAAELNRADLALPRKGWGDIHLKGARPEVGGEWTDSGEASEKAPLKHRAEDDGRTVPCPPELTAILWEHLETFGTTSDGRLFRGARSNGRLSSSVYGRVWAMAREIAFTEEVAAGPLAKRPYDLRHAALSTWLKGAGAGEAPRVALWAGNTLRVLLSVYAKCLDGGEQAARAGVERALGAE
jgi:integrase